MSLHDAGLAIVSVMLVYSWCVSVLLWLAADGMPYTYVLAGMRAPPARYVAFAVVGTTIQAWAAWSFFHTGGWQPELLAVFMLWVIREVQKRTWDADTVVELGRYVPFGTAVAFHLLGRALAPTSDPVLADRFGWEAACGALAMSMGLNGITKFTMSGLKWTSVSGLNLMLAERSVFGPRPLRQLRLMLARSPRFTAALGMLGVVLELAGLLFAVPSARLLIMVGLVLTVLGIEVLLGYFEPEWTLVYPALAMITLA
jgi:hypothetical protein